MEMPWHMAKPELESLMPPPRLDWIWRSAGELLKLGTYVSMYLDLPAAGPNMGTYRGDTIVTH